MKRNTYLTNEQMDELCNVDVIRFAEFVALMEAEYCNGDGAEMTFYDYIDEKRGYLVTEDSFQELNTKKFNEIYGINLEGIETDLEKITEALELEKDLGCFYISYNLKDVLNEIIENELEAIKLKLDCVCLNDLVYIAIYGGGM